MIRTRPRLRAALFTCAALSALAVSSPASAEAPVARRDEAATLFRKGNEAFGEQRWAEAEKAYRGAWEIARTYDIAANFGEVELHLGKHAEAAQLLAYSLRTAPPSAKPAQLERTKHFLEEAKARVGSVRVAVDVDGAKVVIDGKPVPVEDATSPIFLAPGMHDVEASLSGYSTARSRVEIKAACDSDVSLSMQRSRAPLLLFGAAAVVAAGVGTGFLLAGGSKGDEADETLATLRGGRPERQPVCPAGGQACKDIKGLREDRDMLVNVGTVAFIAAGAALAGGVAYAVWPKARPKQTGLLEVSPVAGAEGGGVWLRGAF